MISKITKGLKSTDTRVVAFKAINVHETLIYCKVVQCLIKIIIEGFSRINVHHFRYDECAKKN